MSYPPIYVEDAPFYGDLRAALMAAGLRGGATILYTTTITVSAGPNLSVPRNVAIEGPSGTADPGNPAFAGRVGGYAALAALPKIVLPATVTITAEGSNQFNAVCFARSGLLFDGTDLATSYAGTAFTTGATDAVDFYNCTFLGFQTAIVQTGTARCIYENIVIDCNNGIHQENSFDKSTYNTIHCYNILQSDVDGNDARTKRDGTALWLGGVGNGGPTIEGFFAYGYRRSIHTECAGSYSFNNCWVDGPTSASTGLPLWSDSVGLSCLSTGGSVNAEPIGLGIKVCCHVTGILIGANIYGASVFVGQHNWACVDPLVIAGQNVIVLAAAIRGYKGKGITFSNAAAANTAKLGFITFYDNVGSIAEVDCGGGDPVECAVTWTGGVARYINRVPLSVTRDATGLVLAPDGREQVAVAATAALPAGPIGDIYPRTPGKVITVTFLASGFSLVGANFKLTAGFGGNADSSITLRCNAAGDAWIEQGRAVF